MFLAARIAAPAMSLRDFLTETLPKAAHRKIDAIVAEVDTYLTAPITTVEIDGARVGVETVEAYGLHITLDAQGNAVAITSPYGFLVTD